MRRRAKAAARGTRSEGTRPGREGRRWWRGERAVQLARKNNNFLSEVPQQISSNKFQSALIPCCLLLFRLLLIMVS